jgi:quinol monooxygenase YgiN
VEAHLNGPIAQALMAKADELLARPPSIERIDVLGLKNVGTS